MVESNRANLLTADQAVPDVADLVEEVLGQVTFDRAPNSIRVTLLDPIADIE